MIAGFLTHAAIASVASRYGHQRLFFDFTKMSAYNKVLEWFKSSMFGIPETPDSSDLVVSNAFLHEMQAPFIAIMLCQQKLDGYAQSEPPTMIGKAQDYITPLEEPCESITRVSAELKVLDSLLMSIKRLPRPNPEDRYGLVMGFHPLIQPPDLHNYVGPIPTSATTSATFVLRLILETYKSWYILPPGEERVGDPHLRLCPFSFAQNVHKNDVRFRLSEPFEPTPNCDCEDCRKPDLLERLRMFESDLSMFISEKRFDLYCQSPVVAGYHMTTILARATFLGINSLNIRQHVGVTLHLYNFLRQYDLIEPGTCSAGAFVRCHGPRHLSRPSSYAQFLLSVRSLSRFDLQIRPKIAHIRFRRVYNASKTS